jgi:hypothetical protein
MPIHKVKKGPQPFSIWGGPRKKEVIDMDLVPWRPFGGELTPFRREMDDLWKRFFGEIPLAKRLGEEWWPSVDVLERKRRTNTITTLRDTTGLSSVPSSFLQQYRLIR